MPFSEDLTEFFGASAAFGNDVCLYGPSTWYGIYDEGYAENDEQAGYRPRLTCATADIPGVVLTGAHFTINGVGHKAMTVKPEEDGAVTVLELKDDS